eukprot:scaffold1117_cov379-Prasinococcus_capsulatus_cf.AAC.8
MMRGGHARTASCCAGLQRLGEKPLHVHDVHVNCCSRHRYAKPLPRSEGALRTSRTPYPLPSLGLDPWLPALAPQRPRPATWATLARRTRKIIFTVRAPPRDRARARWQRGCGRRGGWQSPPASVAGVRCPALRCAAPRSVTNVGSSWKPSVS